MRTRVRYGPVSEIENKLAAVLAADVAGYSRLMGDDARATVTSLDECRAFFRARVARAGGRIVDMAGDSVLAVFELATKAVEAAVAIQADLAAFNAPIPDGRRMRYRIGIHLGEVLHKTDGTVYGDGVNIAARLESLAEPGGICVSANVHDVTVGKLEAGFSYAGEHQVKNIARPVRAWRVGAGPEDAPKPAPIEDRPSIVVLPFDNMSGDAEQSYFSDGITEDIITDLSKVPDLFVIARNSAFVYKGKAHNVPDVAAELGVRYVLEGSVRKAGNRVRITTQLIDGNTGGHLWAERYDRDLEDIFAVQDEVTATIVSQLSLRLGPDTKADARRRDKRDLEAWDLYLRGRETTWTLTAASSEKGARILQDVIAMDPDFAAAHAALSVAWTHQYMNGWGRGSEAKLADGLAGAEKALELDPKEPLGHFAHGLALQYTGDLEAARAAVKRAIAIDPNHSLSHGLLGSITVALGQAEEALGYFDAAIRLDPHHPSVILHLAALAHYMLGDYERAREVTELRLSRQVESDSSPFLLAACLGRLGDAEGAKRAWSHVFMVNPEFSIAKRRQTSFYRDKQHFDDIVDGLRLAGIDPDAAPGGDGQS